MTGTSNPRHSPAPAPHVSIAIPAYQGASWIRESVGSALGQAYDSLEVVVCDDGSTDSTCDVVSAMDDPRIRLIESPTRVGMAANWSRAVAASHGRYVKMLMQDDLLEPDCVREMAALLDANPRVGLVFSPRRVEVVGAPTAATRRWLKRLRTVHDRLEPLAPVNDGRRIFELMRKSGFRANWTGEPTVVMVRREAFERVGLFNPRVRQLTDLEMWLRIAFFYDVGFIRRPLATFRLHGGSTTSSNYASGRGWLDRLWLVEGLRQHPEIAARLGPATEARVWANVAASEVGRVVTRRLPAVFLRRDELREYLAFRRSSVRPRLHPSLPPVADADDAASLEAAVPSGADAGRSPS